MLIPTGTDIPQRRNPYANWLIIAANVICFGLQLLAGKKAGAYMLDPGHPSLLTFLTSMFMHGDGWHIAGNMLFLYVFGNRINDRLGNIGYLMFYLLGGVFGGLAYVWTSSPVIPATPFSPAQYAPVLGASGAVSAVTGAFLVLHPNVRVNVLVFNIIGFFTVDVPGWAMVLAFFLMDLLLQILPGASHNVAHTAHLGGSLFGFVAAMALLLMGVLPRSPGDALGVLRQWNRRREYRDAVATGWNPYGLQPTATGRVAADRANQLDDPKTIKVMETRAAISEALAHSRHEQAADLYLGLKLLDPSQVLSPKSQIEVANELTHSQKYPAAVEAYQALLTAYPKHDQVGPISLMLGVLLRRELSRPADAARWLTVACQELPPGDQRTRAEAELRLVADGAAQSPVAPR